MRLAYELGKSREEVLQFSTEEFKYWVAFFNIIQRKSKRSRGQSLDGPKSR
jgi:hypothetical protein